MNIKKILISTAAVALMTAFLFTAGAFAFTAKLSSLEGEVNFKPAGEELWEKAGQDLSLSAGDEVRTGEESWAEISFSQGHMTRLGSGSYMKMAAIDRDTNLELFNGELFSRVRQLSLNERYNITTPESIVSVRGTEFSVVVDESLSETLVRVFSGLVSVLGLESGEEVIIGAGQFSKILKNMPPSDPRDIESPADTGHDDYMDSADDPEDTVEETVSDTKQDLRNEIRSAVSDIRIDVRQAQDSIEQKKETDTSTGRTLRDYHGNLVRVEQHLMRPASDTLHFINITKRDNYRYRGNFNVEPSGSRLDYVETKIEFNRHIPERMSGWFKFMDKISDSDEDFHPEKMTIRFSNRTDSIVMESAWDEIEDDMSEPDITFISGKYGEWKPRKDGEGEVIESGEGIASDPDDDRISFWGISPGLTIEQGVKEKTIRLGMEGWLINNEGKLFSVKDIETGDINPFQAMRRIAFQLSFMPRYNFDADYSLDKEGFSDSDNPAHRRLALDGFNEATDFFSNNIDIVATPDVVFNILEEIAKNVDLSSVDDD